MRVPMSYALGAFQYKNFKIESESEIHLFAIYKEQEILSQIFDDESFFLNCPNIRENGSLIPSDFPEKILCARPSYEKNICKILGPYFNCSSRY